MPESIFANLRRFTHFGPDDEAALAALRPMVAPHAERLAGEIFARSAQHDDAAAFLARPHLVERLKKLLGEWLVDCVTGPWDADYAKRHAHVGRVHVEVGLPQRYLFGAVNLLREALTSITDETYAADAWSRRRTLIAIGRLLDIELAVMLESFREAYVAKVQVREREERQQLRNRLQVSEERYERVVENGVVLVTTFDASGRVHLWNGRCEELSGITREQAVGRDWFHFFVEPEQQAGVRALCDALLSGKRRAATWEGLTSSEGRPSCRFRWYLTTIPDGPDGPDPHGAHGHAVPLLCGIGLDVTEEHELAVRTRRAERLASLGTMAAGLAHEIRNPLNAAHLQLTVVQRRLQRAAGSDVPGALAAAELVSAELQRLAELVEAFLQFARPQPLHLSRIDVRGTARSVTDQLARAAEEAGVELRLDDGPPVMAAADDDRLKQVFLNLVQNAIDATGRGGHVRVRVESAGAEAFFSVEDDGPGIPSPDAPIFEPFYTTKPLGTGLGLSIVHRIVTDHGGRVSVESRPGSTVFSVYVPVAAS